MEYKIDEENKVVTIYSKGEALSDLRDELKSVFGRTYCLRPIISRRDGKGGSSLDLVIIEDEDCSKF